MFLHDLFVHIAKGDDADAFETEEAGDVACTTGIEADDGDADVVIGPDGSGVGGKDGEASRAGDSAANEGAASGLGGVHDGESVVKRGKWAFFATCVLKMQNAPLMSAERFALKWGFWESKTENQLRASVAAAAHHEAKKAEKHQESSRRLRDSDHGDGAGAE